ncbi:MAG TPA: YkgJ family cysteine cluster protein [Chloroflexota bacterium]
MVLTWLLARVKFTVGLERFEETVPVPDGSARPRDLVKTAQALAESIVARAVQSAEANGQAISCRKGCGACCRQVVPVSQPEARQIAALVASLPSERRSVIETRFAAARERLALTDLPRRMAHAEDLGDADRQALAVDYFRQGIACPFLEDESCSIYEDRPLVCREYLVTTPAANCARPTVEAVTRIKLPARISLALGQLEPTSSERGVWWLPLVDAPAWAADHPEEPPTRPAFDVLRDLLGWLKRTA